MSELNYKDTVVKTLALSHYSNVTPRMMEALLNHFGGLDRIFNSGAGTLMSISGMTTKAANKIARASEFIKKANEYYEQLMAVDIKIISRFDNEYPERLFELNDPPSILYYRGKLFQKDAKVVAVTGSDNASQDGIELTTSLAKHLASKNVGIVSSIYNGIDTAGHLGVKPSNGVSYAVLDSGLENIYPEENRPLAVDIVQGGALVTGSKEMYNRAFAIHDLGYYRRDDGRLEFDDPEFQLWGIGCRMN